MHASPKGHMWRNSRESRCGSILHPAQPWRSCQQWRPRTQAQRVRSFHQHSSRHIFFSKRCHDHASLTVFAASAPPRSHSSRLFDLSLSRWFVKTRLCGHLGDMQAGGFELLIQPRDFNRTTLNAELRLQAKLFVHIDQRQETPCTVANKLN